MNRRKMSRRAAAAYLAVPALARMSRVPFGLALSAAAAAQPAPDPADPKLLVRLTLPNPTAFRAAVRLHRIEVVRVAPYEKPAGRVTGLVLLTKSALARISQDPSARIEIVAAPPSNPADVPQVSKVNRFVNPHVLPQGRGQLREER